MIAKHYNIEEYYIPLCFWEDKHSQKTCDCDKVFFDVMIDFKWYRLIICKDWYIMKFKNISQNIDNEITYCFCRSYHVSVISSIINFLIEKYFKTPIEDKFCVEYKNRKNLNLHIIKCDRPFISKEIYIYKFLEYYVYEYRKLVFSKEIKFNHEIEELFKNCISVLKGYCKCYFIENKYTKLRRLIDNFQYNFCQEEYLINFLSEFTKEVTKLKLKNKL